MARWATQYEVRKTRRAAAKLMEEERERRLDDLAAWLDSKGFRAPSKIARAATTR